MSSIPVKDTGIKDALDIIKIVRILAAAALLILANTLNVTAFTFVVLSVAAALIAGFDLVLNAAAAIGEKDYFNYNIINRFNHCKTFFIYSRNNLMYIFKPVNFITRINSFRRISNLKILYTF